MAVAIYSNTDTSVQTDLEEFRQLLKRTKDKNAIRACLLVQQENACSLEPVGGFQAATI